MGNTGILGWLSLGALPGSVEKNPTVYRSLGSTGEEGAYNTKGILGGNLCPLVWKQ